MRYKRINNNAVVPLIIITINAEFLITVLSRVFKQCLCG